MTATPAEMTNVDIREARISDAESIAANIKTQNTADEVREQVLAILGKGAEGWSHLVAVVDGQVVGNLVIMPSRHFPQGQAHRAEVADVVIAPAHQGTGLLGRLMEAAADRARRVGVSQLETSAWESNTRAAAAYLKLGFVEWGRLPDAARHDDGSRDTLVCFVRQL